MSTSLSKFRHDNVTSVMSSLLTTKVKYGWIGLEVARRLVVVMALTRKRISFGWRTRLVR